MVAAEGDGSVRAHEGWRAIPADEVVKQLGANVETGIDPAEAIARLAKHGLNRLPERKKRSIFMRLLAQLNNILVFVLLGAGFTKLMLNLSADVGIILAVVILNGLLGFIQEGKAGFARPINGNKEMELTFGGVNFGDVDVKIANQISFELFLAGLSPSNSGRRPMPWRCRQRCRDERERCGIVACKA